VNKLRRIVLFAVLIIMALCLLLYCKNQEHEEKTPSESTNPSQVATQQTAPPESTVPVTTTGATTEATTVPTTQPTTAATTEATTEATTVATTEETTVPETTEAQGTVGTAVVEFAKEQLGKPFVYGTAGPDSFDASGFVQYCYRKQGISLPRSTQSQSERGTPVEKEELRPGDVVFFSGDDSSKPQIVGIYIGNGKMIATLNEKRPVAEIDMTTSYYEAHFFCARRYY